jgi:hypothetical protein
VEIIITEWALQSYLDLVGRNAFSRDEYWEVLRPDVLLLRVYPDHIKFGNGKFWSQVPEIPGGFKMKWHQVGPGRVQLRLPVGLVTAAVLCEAYVKGGSKEERRRLARCKAHMQLIRQGRYDERGRLS